MAQVSFLSFITKLEKRERVILYITLTVLVLVLLDRVVLSQIFSRIHRLDRKISDQEERIRNSLIITTQEDRILKEWAFYKPYLSVTDTEEKEITTFLKEVENYAKDSSVYLVDIKPAGKKEQGMTRQYFLKLQFEGLMEQVFNFFYVIENSKELLKIDTYQIQPKSEKSSIVTCSMSVSKTIIPK